MCTQDGGGRGGQSLAAVDAELGRSAVGRHGLATEATELGLCASYNI